MGVAAFGPLCLDKNSDQYGYVTTTPKEAWKNFPLLKRLIDGIKR
jgi:fructokinase